MSDYTIIGKRMPRVDSRAKVMGKARFTADLKPFPSAPPLWRSKWTLKQDRWRYSMPPPARMWAKHAGRPV
jgi:hypothetical protein